MKNATPSQLRSLAAEFPRYTSLVADSLAGDEAAVIYATALMDAHDQIDTEEFLATGENVVSRNY